jgi:hypothetical protein
MPVGVAFDKACRSLHAAEHAREMIAKHIIDLAREGDNDPDHLCEVTLQVLGFDCSPD